MTENDSSVKPPKGPGRLIGAPGSDPNANQLTTEEQHQHFKEVVELQLAASRDLQSIALREFKAGIKRAKTTQSVILILNIIMFVFGLILISVAVYAGFVMDKAMYSILFGGIGFADLVASFLVGAMQRSQKSVTDLVQLEIAFLNYFEQVALWEQYASTRDASNNILKENLAEAATKIQSSTAETLELLQKYVENTT